MAVALHWPNPLVWWAERRLRAEREMAADDAALASGSRASDYAGFCWVSPERSARATRWPGAAVLAMAGARPLGERVERLLEPGAADVG